MSPIAESPRTTESPHATTGFPARFFAAAFGFTWAFWILAALADNGLITLPVPSGLLLSVVGAWRRSGTPSSSPVLSCSNSPEWGYTWR
jgi:hypothetical protein